MAVSYEALLLLKGSDDGPCGFITFLNVASEHTLHSSMSAVYFGSQINWDRFFSFFVCLLPQH